MAAAATTTRGIDVGLTHATFAGGGLPLEVADSWGGLDLGIGAAGRGIPGHPGGDDLTLAAERANLERNDEAHRNLARLFTIQAIAQERRATLADLVVDVPAGRPDVIGIAFSVLPVGSVDPLDLAVEVAV